jgi:hypothetical protein
MVEPPDVWVDVFLDRAADRRRGPEPEVPNRSDSDPTAIVTADRESIAT